MKLLHRVLFSAVCVLGSRATVRAQCQDWANGFELPGLNGAVHAMAVYDDAAGFGPALFVGGDFTTAGAVSASRIAKWDGFNWSSVGTGVNGTVRALAVYDNGSGPLLYAGGDFTLAGGIGASRIARWNGVVWSATASFNATVRSLHVYSGRLYAGGDFTSTGRHVASTNGGAWAQLGAGAQNGADGPVYSLATFQGVLYVAGQFDFVGSTITHSVNVAKWNGSAWMPVSLGPTALVRCMTVFDDGLGGGPALYLGGDFSVVGPGDVRSHITGWDGTASFAVGLGMNNDLYTLSEFGGALYAGGAFTMAGGTSAIQIARWNGSAWSSASTGTNGRVHSLAVFDDGLGPRLFTGGLFTTAGGVGANRIAKFDGLDFAALGPGVNDGMLGSIRSFTTHDDGAGTKLYAGGEFTSAGGSTATRIAKWNGANWFALGSGADGMVAALAPFDEGLGAGEELFAGGSFYNVGGTAAHTIAKWDGSNWFAVGAGLEDGLYGEVRALTAWNDGGGDALYAGGSFTTSAGMFVRRIAKWNGVTWSPLGNGTSGVVHALAVFDDGSGDALYAGGEFGVAGGVTVNFVAKWDGSTWSALGTGMDGPVYALAVHDDGSGPALYAGGAFASAGGNTVNSIAKWDGSNWSALGGGVSNVVYALASFDQGSGGGEELYAAGDFDTARGLIARNIARWDGSAWSLLAVGATSGTNGPVYALQVFDDQLGGGADLYVGGEFTMAGEKLSSNVAQWSGCGGPGTAYCFGDNVDPLVTTDCPCSNFGIVGHGCGNPSTSLGGARLDASGSTLLNTVKMVCNGIPNNNQTFFVEGDVDTPAGFVLGDGVSCVMGTLSTFGTQFAGQSGNPINTASAFAPMVAPGNTRYYYARYRTINSGFCPPELFNVSNAYRITW